jgi:hypothetical protein
VFWPPGISKQKVVLSSSACKTATGSCRQPVLSIPHSHKSSRSGHHWYLHPLCLVLQVTVFKGFPPKYLPFLVYSSQFHSQHKTVLWISDLAFLMIFRSIFVLPYDMPTRSGGSSACRVGRYGTRRGPILTYSRRRGVTMCPNDWPTWLRQDASPPPPELYEQCRF